jgi:hypothetical protein
VSTDFETESICLDVTTFAINGGHTIVSLAGTNGMSVLPAALVQQVFNFQIEGKFLLRVTIKSMSNSYIRIQIKLDIIDFKSKVDAGGKGCPFNAL